MVLIRRSEELICENYYDDEMKTPVHLSIGEEGIVAGSIEALSNDDPIFGTYRSHGIYLARTYETDEFFAELYGKISTIANGKTGSMHLTSFENHFQGSSAIVGASISVAVGSSYANKHHKSGLVTAVFFGDGAVDEGAFWESLNIACLYKLPIIFICEDNGLAIHSTQNQRRGYDSLPDIITNYNCKVFKSNSTDPEVIYDIVSKSRKIAIEEQMPVFLNLEYYRYLEHVGVNEDFECGYRSREEFEKWNEKDPILLQEKKLLDQYHLQKSEIDEIYHDIDEKIMRSIVRAKKLPFPDPSTIYEDVY